MGKRIDLTGQRFGMLVARYINKNNINKKSTMWYCECDCGNYKDVSTSDLKLGKVKSCGCLCHKIQRQDLIGKRYGSLIVKSYSHNIYRKVPVWNCQCDCGNEVKVRGDSLKHNNRQSCGKCKLNVYRLSKCGKYYEGYFISNLIKINKKSNDVDLYLFELGEITIENKNVNLSYEEFLKLKEKPDFIFDECYLQYIEKYNWTKNLKSLSVYRNCEKNNTSIPLQTFIMKLANKYLELTDKVTFKNNKNYDFRLENLLFLNRSELSHRNKVGTDKFGYKGVRLRYGKKGLVYTSHITHKGEMRWIGTFKTAEKAAQAYNKKARELFGKFAYQNVIKKIKKVK